MTKKQIKDKAELEIQIYKTRGKDQLWKTVIMNFFEEFMKTFVPEEAKKLNFSKQKFLDKEAFTHFLGGRHRYMDIVAEVPFLEETEEGKAEIIIVHVEVQGSVEKDFDRRMWEYYMTLRPKYNKKILPMALFLHAHPEKEMEWGTYKEYVMDALISTFSYLKIYLKNLPSKEYWNQNILASIMSVGMKVKKDERVELMRDARIKLRKSNIDGAKKFLLLNLLHSCSNLTEEEEEEYNCMMKKYIEENYEEEIPFEELSWGGKLLYKREQKVKKEGKKEGMAQLLIGQLRNRFNEIPKKIQDTVKAMNTKQLTSLGNKLFSVQSLEELFH